MPDSATPPMVPLDQLLTPDALWRYKRLGFGDAQIAGLLSRADRPIAERDVRALRRRWGVRPAYRMVDTCAGEFEAATPYFYGSYDPGENEAVPSSRKKVLILGGGPNRIGQGIEFDYCCVQAVFALRRAGYEAIMINSNPETVSTDYDIADRLYLEPVTAEDVLNVCDLEKPDGVIVQFGGQTPLKLAAVLRDEGVQILGTSPDSIDIAEDRRRFAALLVDHGIPHPKCGSGTHPDELAAVAKAVGYPVVVRPSYVLGGRGMAVVHDEEQLRRYLDTIGEVSPDHPILVDQFLDGAIEVDVDAVADRTGACTIAAMMEHIEEAGIHSGDSACMIPMRRVSPLVAGAMRRMTESLARALHVVGLMNVQFAVKGERASVLEVNPRASRTVPFVSKAIGRSIAQDATRAMLGETLREIGFARERHIAHWCVKEAVLPFDRFPGARIALGPEMRSTGEVMGIGAAFGEAFGKSQDAAGCPLPASGGVVLSVNDEDKADVVPVARGLAAMGFHLLATAGTHAWLAKKGVASALVAKVGEGSPHVVDAMEAGRVHLVINTVMGKQSHLDEAALRRTAIARRIPMLTTVAAAHAAVEAIAARNGASPPPPPRALQDYHAAMASKYSAHPAMEEVAGGGT